MIVGAMKEFLVWVWKKRSISDSMVSWIFQHQLNQHPAWPDALHSSPLERMTKGSPIRQSCGLIII
ncbi:hypothetical protein E2C01_003753 [Portunus trituberculatus]|uniref:Uncharacterized protein n=1 Tax=Portunus trituberculatus TaxID=210409 RepID=A0A5B7CNJ1_PORTR|nr:hypothetical protein [Portunus trituberculatus]